MQSKGKTLVAIDLGNSAATYGVFSGARLLSHGYVPSDNVPKLGQICLGSGRNRNSHHVIICSVVPHLTNKLLKLLTKNMARRAITVVGRDVQPKVPMKYRLKVLGADRLVNIYGALRCYKPPILVVDFGTAITFDYVSKSGIFEGGLIVPGIGISSNALYEKTALLPKIGQVQSTHGFVGHDTKAAMSSGLLNGFGALSDGLIARFRRRYGRGVKTLATGGYVAKIIPYTSAFDYVDPLHTIKSLALMYWKEVERSNPKRGSI